MNKVVVITGQTATGKTKLALEYATRLNGELVNCDARQVYKYLDIITGKDLSERNYHHVKMSGEYSVGYHVVNNTKLWLYDIVEPSQYFSSHGYAVLASSVISDIIDAGKVPIIIGGSYFYLKHLLYGNLNSQQEPDLALRNHLNAMTTVQLQTHLNELAPQIYTAMNNSDRNNSRRLIRAIERSKASSQIDVMTDSYTYTLGTNVGINSMEIEYIGLRHAVKEQLTATIIKRVDERLANGAIEELQQVLELGYTPKDPGMKTIGCIQLYKHLAENMPLDKAREEWILKEVQYAKRQYTFMKRDTGIKWRISA